MAGWIHPLSVGISWLAVAAMGVSLLTLLVRYLAEPFAPGIAFAPLVRSLVQGKPLRPQTEEEVEISPDEQKLRQRLHRNEWALYHQLQIFTWVLCVALLSRLVILASALVGSWITGGLDSFFQDAAGHWIRWDAQGYLALAEGGYGADGNQAYLVLLPLYPALVNLLSRLLMGHTALAAMLLSNLTLAGAGWALYNMVHQTQGQVAAKRAVQLLMFFPLSVFFSVPYADSLFLFLTLTSVLMAREKRFLAATVMGALASATRLAGILTIIPVALEAFRGRQTESPARGRGRDVIRLALRTLLVLCISLGLISYLIVNQVYFGSPWAFIRVQAQEWSQGLGSLANTLRYSMETAFTEASAEWRLGVWWPQVLGILSTVVLLSYLSSRMDPGDGLYAWVYLTITLAPTWLLTGPRMLAGLYALYPMLTQFSRPRGIYAVLLAAFIALTIFYSYMYVVVGSLL